MLTLEVARGRGLCVKGVIINETSPVETMAEITNVEELTRRIDVPVLAVIPYRLGGYDGPIPALAHLDWWSLIGS